MRAGIKAIAMILIYGVPVNSAIINAPAPIIGGNICPPVEAATSIAPASSAVKPVFFIKGIVKAPVVATFATLLPETEPIIALLKTAVFATPPLYFPSRALQNSI
ncbi:hypothetical protein ES705_34029 [subsurface metagenome]